MKSFFLAVIYASVIGGLSAALVGKAYEKHLRYLASLLCLTLVISPFLSLTVGDELGTLEYDEASFSAVADAEELIVAQTLSDAEEAVENYIFEQTGIKVKSVGIDIESVGNDLYYKKINVCVYNDEDVSTVEESLSKLTEGSLDTEVYV